MLGIKQAFNMLEKEFASQGLLTHEKVDPKHIGFSPENRNNYGRGSSLPDMEQLQSRLQSSCR